MSNNRYLRISPNNDSVLFPLYRRYQAVGTEMKQDFFDSDLSFEEKDYTDRSGNKLRRYAFKLSESNPQEGIMGMSYGVFLMATLMDRFEQHGIFTKDEKEKLRNTILALLEYVEKNGYDVTPFSTPAINGRLFDRNGETAFIESLTWALSCFLYAKRLHQIDDSMGLGELMPRLTDKIAQCLGILVDSVISIGEDGRPMTGYSKGCTSYIGWGPVTGCTETSLYFTHSVCETYGDIEDTMLGNAMLGSSNTRDQAYIDEVNRAYKRLKYGDKAHNEKDIDIVKRFEDICRTVGKNVYEKYEKSLGRAFFYANGAEISSNEHLAYALQSPVLLNQLYVVLIAVYVNYHQEVQRISESRKDDRYKDFCTTLKNAVDLVHETYITLQAKSKAGVVNREYVTFSEAHPKPEIAQMLSGERINVAVLETLIIKARAMIVTYVTKYPEREIGEVLEIIEKTRSDSSWLWSRYGYDLQQTERSIGAIREFYDYYENYQRIYAECDEKSKDIAEQEARAWLENERTADAINRRKELADMQSRFEEEKRLAVEQTRDSFKIDGIVREIVKDEVRSEFVTLFADYLNAIAEDNGVPPSKSKLTDEEKIVKQAMIGFVLSFLKPYNRAFGRPEGIRDEWTDDQLFSMMSNDIAAFTKEWVYQVCMKNEPGSSNSVEVLSESIKNK